MNDRIDPITLEVIKNALGTIADEMALVVMRTAYSNIMRAGFRPEVTRGNFAPPRA